MKNYKYVLFDWDGCLAKTLEPILIAYKETFAEYGKNPTDQEIVHIFGDWQGPKYLGIPESEVEEFTKEFAVKALEASKSVELYEGVRELLEKLKPKAELAVLTSSKREYIDHALDMHSLKDYFDVVLAAEDVAKHKPDPEVIEKCLDKMSGSKDESVIIGDSKSDLGAAQNAGIDSILFYPDSHKVFYDFEHLKTFNPTRVVKSFQELSSLL